MRFLDGFGSEDNIGPGGTGPNWNVEICDYRRAMAGHRAYTFANQTVGLSAGAARVASGLQVLYGVPSGMGPNAAAWEEGAEELVAHASELVRRFWAAGWEPVTHARAADPAVLVERFGRWGTPWTPAAPRGIFLTCFNATAEPVRTELTVETADLGIDDPAAARVRDLASEVPLPFTATAGRLHVPLALEPFGYTVVQIAPHDLSRHPGDRTQP